MVLKNPQSKKPAQRPGGDVQSRIDLQELVKDHLGEGLPGGSCISYQSPFDPDDFGYSWQVFKTYFRDVRNGDRGGAIKFVQRWHRCSKEMAIGILIGWLLRGESRR